MAHAPQHNLQQYSTLQKGDNLQQTLPKTEKIGTTIPLDLTLWPCGGFWPAILWMRMQEYYASSCKWKFNNESTTTDNGSTLIWTMLHLSVNTWNWTYAWHQLLDEYTAWTPCQILSWNQYSFPMPCGLLATEPDLMAATMTRNSTAMTRARTQLAQHK